MVFRYCYQYCVFALSALVPLSLDKKNPRGSRDKRSENKRNTALRPTLSAPTIRASQQHNDVSQLEQTANKPPKASSEEESYIAGSDANRNDRFAQKMRPLPESVRIQR